MKTASEYIAAALVVLALCVDGWGCAKPPGKLFRDLPDTYREQDGGAP